MALIPIFSQAVAAVFVYLDNTCLAEIQWTPETRKTVYVIEIDQKEFDGLLKSYMSEEGLAISSIRHYAQVVKDLGQKAKIARESEFGVWSRIG